MVSSAESVWLASTVVLMMACWLSGPVELSFWTLFLRASCIWLESGYAFMHLSTETRWKIFTHFLHTIGLGS